MWAEKDAVPTQAAEGGGVGDGFGMKKVNMGLGSTFKLVAAASGQSESHCNMWRLLLLEVAQPASIKPYLVSAAKRGRGVLKGYGEGG
jgi:hypothetical protein